MKQITFITGNAKKAEYLERYLGFPIAYQKVKLDEIQSLDLCKIVEHKVKQAYDIIKQPVLVEDVSLEFTALGKLPGPFIRFFVDEVPFETICSMIDGKTREAFARSVFGYYDGKTLKLIEGCLRGEIARKPEGENGYGWDKIFIPDGYGVTRASLNEEDDQKTYLQFKPLENVKKILINIS